MATRTPPVSGLTVQPNAVGDANNPAASTQELAVHRFWGRYDATSALPNASANAAASPSYDAMRPGDVAQVEADGELYELVDRGTSGGADAAWRLITSSAILQWGAEDITSGTQATFLFPGGLIQAITPAAALQYRVPRGGLARNFGIRHNTPAGNGNTVVYTLRRNGAAAGPTVSLISTGSDGSDFINTATFAPGDLIDVEVSKAVDIGSGVLNVVATLEYR